MYMGEPDNLAQAQAVIARLFDDRVSVAVTDPREPQPALLAGEAEHLSRAVPKRQREFAAGRAAARAAMASLGAASGPVPVEPSRAPAWPDGIRGSISHTDDLCAAAVTNAALHIGLDIEKDTDLKPQLLSTICSAAECARIAGPDQLRLAKLIFSAKEAAYKAQFPITGQVFGFDHMDVALDLEARTFTATFLKPAGAFPQGHMLLGRFDHVAGHLVTGVMTRQGSTEGA